MILEEIHRSFKRDHCLLSVGFTSRFYNSRAHEVRGKMANLPKHHGGARRGVGPSVVA